jgi:hypothetical protein
LKRGTIKNEIFFKGAGIKNRIEYLYPEWYSYGGNVKK